MFVILRSRGKYGSRGGDPSYHRSAPDDRINDSIYTASRQPMRPDLLFPFILFLFLKVNFTSLAKKWLNMAGLLYLVGMGARGTRGI